MKRIIAITLMFFMFSNVVNAECTKDDVKRFKKLADNVTYVIEKYDDYKKDQLDILFSGVSKELILKSASSNQVVFMYDDYFNDATIFDVKPNSIIKVEIYGSGNCYNDRMRTITINIPGYNQFYYDPICEQARNYKLCQKWVNVDMTYEKFLNEVQNYIDSEKHNNENKQPSISNSRDFYYYFQKYYWIILSLLVITLGILEYLWIKQNKKNQL